MSHLIELGAAREEEGTRALPSLPKNVALRLLDDCFDG